MTLSGGRYALVVVVGGACVAFESVLLFPMLLFTVFINTGSGPFINLLSMSKASTKRTLFKLS
jgi:hypothetical protein